MADASGSPTAAPVGGLVVTGTEVDDAAWGLRVAANYLESFTLARDSIADAWMPRTAALLARAEGRLSQKPPVNDLRSIERALRNGWNTELLLSLPLDEQSLVQPANHWAAIQAYYAIQAVSLAWFVCGGNPPQTHAAQLALISDMLSRNSSVPYPLNIVCSSLRPVVVTERARRAIKRVPALTASKRPTAASAEGYLFSALSHARRSADEDKLRRWRHANPGRQRRSSSVVKKHDQELGTTTFAHLLWEMRLQANYRDSASFTSDGIAQDDPQRFLVHLAELVSTLNLVFERLVSMRVGTDLLQTTLDGISGPHTSSGRGPYQRRLYWGSIA